MKIVVIGGSGLIGSKLVHNLRMLGHEVFAASPATGVNTLTGEGLAQALENTQVVVDVSNSPSFDDRAVLDFFETSGRNLLAAERATGVGHHVALSVVGTEQLEESGYFRGKIAQEKLIRESGMPYTIVHSTQFFEFLGGIVKAGSEGRVVRVPTAAVQPIAADDVAAALTEVTLDRPVNGVMEIAGPDRFPLPDLIQLYLDATDDQREVIGDPWARYFGALLTEATLLPRGFAHVGNKRVTDWLVTQRKLENVS